MLYNKNRIKNNEIKSKIILTIHKPNLIRRVNWSKVFQLSNDLLNNNTFNSVFHDCTLTLGTKNDPSIGAIIINSNHT